MESLLKATAGVHPVMEVRVLYNGFVGGSVDVVRESEPVEFADISLSQCFPDKYGGTYASFRYYVAAGPQ